MDPELAKAIMKYPEGKALVSFLAGLMLELNTLPDNSFNNPYEYTIEGKARKRAYEKLKTVLEPLLSIQPDATVIKKDEYSV